MALKDALKKIGSVVGDVAKAAFNAIPLVPNIPASNFNSPGIANVSNIVSGLTTTLGKAAISALPGGSLLKGAANIVTALVPATKSESKSSSALPSAISTAGYVQNTLSASTKGLSAPAAPVDIPKTIGIAQQTSAPVQSTGSQIHVPVNSSGLGIFTMDVPPVAVTQTGYVSGSSGLIAKAPDGLGNLATLLPTSEPAEKIAEVAGKIAEVANKPTNPTQQPKSWVEENIVALGLGLLALIGGAVALSRK